MSQPAKEMASSKDDIPLLNDPDKKTTVNPSYSSTPEPVTQDEKITCFVYTLSLMSAIGGFLFGYDTGIISGSMLLLVNTFHLTPLWQEFIVSITILFAAIGAFLSGFLNTGLGRKPVILIASIIFTTGALALGFATSKEMLLMGRAIIGIAVGLASMTVPVYIAESSPSRIRGRLVTLFNLFVTLGQFCAGVIAGLFSYDTINGWRYMLGLASVPSIIQFVAFLFLYESPRWLIGKGRLTSAENALKAILGTDNVHHIVVEIKKSYENDEKEIQEKGNGSLLLAVIKSPAVVRALFVGCMLQCFQQLSGINTVMYYSATIIKLSGVSDESTAIWLASITAGANFLFALSGLWFVERIGRRQLTLGSMIGTGFALAFLAIGFQISAFTSPPVEIREQGNNTYCDRYTFCDPCMMDTKCGYCYEEINGEIFNGSCVAVTMDPNGNPVSTISQYGRCSDTQRDTNILYGYDYCPTKNAWMVTIGLILYLMCFSPGLGPMPWTINSEIYPLWARSLGNSLSTMTNWLFNLLISMTFLTLTQVLTRYGAFWLYSGLTIIGVLFVYKFLPETKGKKLEEVEQLFEKPFF